MVCLPPDDPHATTQAFLHPQNPWVPGLPLVEDRYVRAQEECMGKACSVVSVMS